MAICLRLGVNHINSPLYVFQFSSLVLIGPVRFLMMDFLKLLSVPRTGVGSNHSHFTIVQVHLGLSGPVRSLVTGF